MFALRFGHVDFHAAKLIHQIGQHAVMDGYGAVDFHAEILFQRLLQKRLSAVKIGGVEPGSAMAGNGHVQIPQEGRQTNVIVFDIHTREHHCIAAARPIRRSAVHADEQQVHHAVLLRRGASGKYEQCEHAHHDSFEKHKNPSFAQVYSNNAKEGLFHAVGRIRCNRYQTAPPAGSTRQPNGHRR